MYLSGHVQSRVPALNRQLVGTSAGDSSSMNRRHSMPPIGGNGSRVRHGTADQGARPRRRSRGRDDGSVRPRGVKGRSQPVGPEEEQEWIQALEATNDRIDTLEPLQRMSAQTTNHFDESLRGWNLRKAEVCSDINHFRSSVSTAHSNMDRVISDRLANLQSQIDALTRVLSSMPPPDSIDRQILTIEKMIADMN